MAPEAAVSLGDPIYLDCHATTPLDPRVLEAMLPSFTRDFGNASSRQHAFGWKAEAAVKAARETVAAAIGASPREVVFTSGATESNNLALFGVSRALAPKGRHLVTTAVEHSAVLDPCRQLVREGFEVDVVGVDRDGKVSVDSVAAALRPDTVLVSVMAANNEVGTLQPLAEIGALCKERGVLLHTDAAQAFGKVPLDVEALGVDLMSLSAHKLCGPKGVGALYVRAARPRVTLEPLLFGGGHERGLRSGTLDVPGIVGLGAAARIAVEEREAEAGRVARLRDRLHELLAAAVPGVELNGPAEGRLPGNLNLRFPGVDGEALTLEVRDVAFSTGAACSSASREPSHVLLALGLSEAQARSSVRFGLGRFTTEGEVEEAARRVAEGVARLAAARAVSPGPLR